MTAAQDLDTQDKPLQPPTRGAGPMHLPPNLAPYRRTDTFTEKTVPAGLLRAHATKSQTWGLIHVLEGALAYRITDARRAEASAVLTPETDPGVVEPTILHEVEPMGPVRFYVEFHKPETEER